MQIVAHRSGRWEEDPHLDSLSSSDYTTYLIPEYIYNHQIRKNLQYCCCCRTQINKCNILHHGLDSDSSSARIQSLEDTTRRRDRNRLGLFKNNVLISQIRLFSRFRLSLFIYLCLFLFKPYVKPIESILIDRNYYPLTNNTGQYTISQLCPRNSNIPITKRVDGASLSSNYTDTDMNCTITFRTKNAHQHFIIHFEELKLGCEDHLQLFDQDLDYGQPSIVHYTCRDNMASVRDFKTNGTFLTVKYTADEINTPGDGFRFVITAVFDNSYCPPEYGYCRDQYCISRSLFCDGTYHCLDKSDEFNCHIQEDPNDLPYALGLLVLLVLAISACVIIFIATIYCKRESPYSQYQHQLQRAVGVPLQASSSIMFPNHQTQFFQPAQMSPYVTPQHHLQDGQTSHQLPIIVLYRNDPGNL